MDSKNTISISEARKKIFDIADEVQKPDTYYILTENGAGKAVIMSLSEFESWQETLAIYDQFPDLAKEVAEVDRDLQSGKWKTYPSLEEVMAKQGFMVAERPRNNFKYSNELLSNNKAKGKKKTRKNSRTR